VSDHTKPRLVIPAYDHALHDFMTSVVEGMRGVDPLLGVIRSRQSGHAGPVRNVPGPEPVDHVLTTFEDEVAIHKDVIRGTDVEQFITIIVDVARKYLEAMGATFFQTVSQITEATGNSIDVGGQPLSWDLILDGLEQKEIAFDEEGKLAGEMIVMNPRTAQILASIEMTPEQEERLNDILQRKKEAWDAQQRTRRLPRPR
jgi:hypothetical protein